jgi:hypothetical protein
MRTGGSKFMDAAAVSDDGTVAFDWLNLPSGTNAVSLWDSLDDAHVVAIRSDLLERSMVMICEIEHLRSFHQLGDGFQLIIRLAGIQSARVLRYEIWPGEFSTPAGVSREEERRMIAEYQAKWREESTSWKQFEAAITPEYEQVFDISDAALATFRNSTLALKLCGHLNYATYHEVCLRFEALRISGSDGRQFALEDLQRLGEAYWEAFALPGEPPK